MSHKSQPFSAYVTQTVDLVPAYVCVDDGGLQSDIVFDKHVKSTWLYSKLNAFYKPYIYYSVQAEVKLAVGRPNFQTKHVCYLVMTENEN